MTTQVLEKAAKELTAKELAELLAQKQAEENAERVKKREQYVALRDETVTAMVSKASAISDLMKTFKKTVWSELDTMYKLLQEHSQRHADGKGNFSMETTDGNMKVSFRRQETTKFDERATQAEKHIIDFLTSQYADDSPDSKLIRRLLERKKDHLDKDRVLELISMKDDFDNDNWRKGIELLQESIVPGDTRYYAQFFVKGENNEWMPIVLDFAKL